MWITMHVRRKVFSEIVLPAASPQAYEGDCYCLGPKNLGRKNYLIQRFSEVTDSEITDILAIPKLKFCIKMSKVTDFRK